VPTVFVVVVGSQTARHLAVTGRRQQSCKAVYAVVRDSGGTSLTVCSGATRRTLYKSFTNIVEIQLVGSKTALHSAGLLVRFDGISSQFLNIFVFVIMKVIFIRNTRIALNQPLATVGVKTTLSYFIIFA